jgi:hypothetical protein
MCPRSYCFTCLKRLVTSTLYEQIQTDDDWQCLTCQYGHSSFEPLPKNKWKMLNRSMNIPKPSSPKKNQQPNHPEVKLQAKALEEVAVESKKEEKHPTPRIVIAEEAPIAAAVEEDLPLKRRRVKSERALESVDVEKVLLNSSLPSNATAAKKRIRAKLDKAGPSANQAPAPATKVAQVAVPEPVVDELFYFQQYVLYYDRLCKECSATTSKIKVETDDACFLCKDGGDLIECDWVISGKKHSRCRKVYHSACLSYVVEDDQSKWYCPRHFCDVCGELNLAYACLFCPVSICSKCPEEMVRKYGHIRYVELDYPSTGEFTKSNLKAIACQSCLDMITKTSQSTRTLSPELRKIAEQLLQRQVKKFPGKPGEEYLKHGGLFKREAGQNLSGASQVISQQQLKQRRPREVKYNEEEYPYVKRAVSDRRRTRWTVEEDEDLEVAFAKHGHNIDAIEQDTNLSKSFKSRPRDEVDKKLQILLLRKMEHDDKVDILESEGKMGAHIDGDNDDWQVMLNTATHIPSDTIAVQAHGSVQSNEENMRASPSIGDLNQPSCRLMDGDTVTIVDGESSPLSSDSSPRKRARDSQDSLHTEPATNINTVSVSVNVAATEDDRKSDRAQIVIPITAKYVEEESDPAHDININMTMVTSEDERNSDPAQNADMIQVATEDFAEKSDPAPDTGMIPIMADDVETESLDPAPETCMKPITSDVIKALDEDLKEQEDLFKAAINMIEQAACSSSTSITAASSIEADLADEAPVDSKVKEKAAPKRRSPRKI